MQLHALFVGSRDEIRRRRCRRDWTDSPSLQPHNSITYLIRRFLAKRAWYKLPLVPRAFSTCSNIAVYSNGSNQRNTMCNISVRSYRSRIAGCVKCDYSTRRGIVAPSSRCRIPSDPLLSFSRRSLTPPVVLTRFFAPPYLKPGLSPENLLNSGSFIPKIGGQWRVNSRGNTRTLRDSSHNQSVGYSGWKVRERADHLMFILKRSVWRM